MKAKTLAGIVSLAMTGAALAAGAGQAAERPDDRAGLLGVGGAQAVTVAPDAFERAAGRLAATGALPDAFERAVAREAGVVLRPDDRAGARGPGLVPVTLAVTPATSDAGGRWEDVLVGAAGMLAAVLLAGAAALTIRHRGRVILP